MEHLIIPGNSYNFLSIKQKDYDNVCCRKRANIRYTTWEQEYKWLEGCKHNKNLIQTNICWSSGTYHDSMHAIGENNKKLWKFWKPITSKDYALDKMVMIHYPDKQLQQIIKLIWVPTKNLMPAWLEANAFKLYVSYRKVRSLLLAKKKKEKSGENGQPTK